MRLGSLGSMVKNPSAFVGKKAEPMVEVQKEPEIIEEISAIVEEPVALDSMHEAVQAFAELMKQEGKFFSNAFVKSMVIEEQGNTLLVTITNTRDNSEFDQIKSSFLAFVNKQTGKQYSLEVKIDKLVNQVLTVYTNKDKFYYLAERFPYLIDFSKELGLEYE